MVELLSQDFDDGWRYAKTNNSVAITWLISFDQIQRLDPLSAEYLFSCHALILGISLCRYFHQTIHKSGNTMLWVF